MVRIGVLYLVLLNIHKMLAYGVYSGIFHIYIPILYMHDVLDTQICNCQYIKNTNVFSYFI